MCNRFQKTLAEIASDLKSEQTKSIIFVAEGTVQGLHLDKCRSPLQLFEKLKQHNLLTQENTHFLKGLLDTIGRKDLADILPYPAPIESTQVSESRALLFQVMDGLRISEVQNLRYILEVPESFLINDAIDLAWYLLQSDTISYLAEAFNDIKRADLSKRMTKYYKIIETTTFEGHGTNCTNVSSDRRNLLEVEQIGTGTMLHSPEHNSIEFDGKRGYCHVCCIKLTSMQHHDQHIRGKPHIQKLNQFEKSPDANVHSFKEETRTLPLTNLLDISTLEPSCSASSYDLSAARSLLGKDKCLHQTDASCFGGCFNIAGVIQRKRKAKD